MKLQVVSGLKRVKMKLKVVSNSKQLFSTSNLSEMKLQVVSNFNRVNNEATSCFRAQTSKDETKSRFQLQTTENEATSCFQHQTSLK